MRVRRATRKAARASSAARVSGRASRPTRVFKYEFMNNIIYMVDCVNLGVHPRASNALRGPSAGRRGRQVLQFLVERGGHRVDPLVSELPEEG